MIKQKLGSKRMNEQEVVDLEEAIMKGVKDNGLGFIEGNA
jgi:hypothetical protein